MAPLCAPTLHRKALPWPWPVLLLLLASGLGPGQAAGEIQRGSVIGRRVPGCVLTDLAGKRRSLAALRGSGTLVILFLGTTCPISNRSSEACSQLARRYRDARVLGVCADPETRPEALARHAAAFRLAFPLLRDEKQELARQLQARVTPEAFILDRRGVVRYRGRIDDSGRTGQRVSREPRGSLERALRQVLAGTRVTTPVTEAVGCPIERRAKVAAAPAATFHRDVEPILQQRCQPCHRPGQVAPFSLLDYASARSRARLLQQTTTSRRMPPWLPEPGHGEFEGTRRLTGREIAVLAAWANAGAPKGNPAAAPAPRRWTEGWTLGKPDLVLSLPQPHALEASGDDEFRVFVLPTGLLQERQVVAVDIRPGNPRVVHHAMMLVDTTGRGRDLDGEDAAPGYDSGPGGVRVRTAEFLGLWTPGNQARFLPPGVGRTLPRASDLLLQLHYHRTGKPETDRTQVGLYFARKPVTREARTVIMGGWHAAIPAGADRHEVRATDRMPVDVRLLTIMPHMHLLGREMKVTATLPDGTRKDLVWVRNWDYQWQEAYRFRKPPLLPRGTEVELIAWFDNSAGNPRNPHTPPRPVTFGEGTAEEMASVIIEGVVEPRGSHSPFGPTRLSLRPAASRRAAASRAGSGRARVP